jgi:hypothetical protein
MYGVLLWEILTFAREQPFENLTDEKVIENIGHIYQDNKKHVSSHDCGSDRAHQTPATASTKIFLIKSLASLIDCKNFASFIIKLLKCLRPTCAPPTPRRISSPYRKMFGHKLPLIVAVAVIVVLLKN